MTRIATRLIDAGKQRDEAYAAACWQAHSGDTQADLRALFERAESFRHASRIAQACEFEISVVLAARTPMYGAESVGYGIDTFTDDQRDAIKAGIKRIERLVRPFVTHDETFSAEVWTMIQRVAQPELHRVVTLVTDLLQLCKAELSQDVAASMATILRELMLLLEIDVRCVELTTPRPAPRPRGKQPADRIKAMCADAVALGITPKKLARAAIDDPRLLRGFPEIALKMGKVRDTESEEDAVDGLRQRLQKHFA